MYDIVIDEGISVWGYSAKRHRENLAKLDGNINIFVSSYGGDVYEAIDIYNMNKEYYKNKGEVTITVGSKAMSAGAIITMSGSKKIAHSNSTFMIHRAWTIAFGNAVELEAEAKILNGIDGIQARDFSKAMGKTEDELLNILSNDTYYVGEQELRETGIFDEILNSEEADDEVSSIKEASRAFASAKKEFLAKAEDEEYVPNIASAKKAILNCNGGKCPSMVIGAVPSQEKPAANQNKKEKAMAEMTEQEAIAKATADATKRAADIAAIGSKYGISAEAIHTAIVNGSSIQDFQATALENINELVASARQETANIQAKLDEAIKIGASEDNGATQEPEAKETEKESKVLAAAEQIEV